MADIGSGILTQNIPIHLVLVMFLLTLLIVSSFFMNQFRSRKMARELSELPHTKKLPLKQIKKNMYERILKELVKSKGIQKKIIPKEAIPGYATDNMINNVGAVGWGLPGTEYDRVHFKKSISNSWKVLEQSVIARYPKYKRNPSWTISEYIEFLQANIPNLNKRLCTVYIEFYEKAKYSDYEFSLHEYTNFVNNFFVMVSFDVSKEIIRN